jgi:hypothetical protein
VAFRRCAEGADLCDCGWHGTGKCLHVKEYEVIATYEVL